MRATLCSAPLLSSPEKQLAGQSGAHISARDAQAETWLMKEDGMNTMALVHTNDSVGGKSDASRQTLKTKLQVAGVAAGLIGGVLSGISGGALIAASWLSANAAARHWLSGAGSTLLLLTIPLIILGAFCLDWLEKNQPQHQTNSTLNDNDKQ